MHLFFFYFFFTSNAFKKKKTFFNLTVQYLEQYNTAVQQLELPSVTSCTIAALTLASRQPGLEIKMLLYYCSTVLYIALYSTVRGSTATCGGCRHLTICQTHELRCVWTCECMFTSLKVHNLKVQM